MLRADASVAAPPSSLRVPWPGPTCLTHRVRHSGARCRFVLLIGIVFLGFVSTTSRAAATTVLAEGYALRVWQIEDGLPQNLVTSAVQTRDGHLWFGTNNGLARFDGERFRVFDSLNTPDLRDRRIAALSEDDHGTLWIGHEAGLVTTFRDGRFQSLAPESPSGGARVVGLGSDEQGRMWAMRVDGTVESLDHDRHHLPSLIAPELSSIMAWTRSDKGEIWVAENGRVARLEDGRLISPSLPPPRHENYVMGIAAAADGGVWLLCDNRIRKWKDGRWMEDRGEFPWPEASLACARELRDGTLAVGTIYSGLYLIFPDGRPNVHLDRTNGLPQNWVRFLYEDREGNLWLGSGSAGLVSIHATGFSVLKSPDQWQGCSVLAVAPGRGGALWFGTDGAALYRLLDGRWSHFGSNEGLTNPYIPAVTESPAGEVWAGAFWWGTPYRLENGSFIRPAGVPERSPQVFALVSIPGTDEILVGNRGGLLQLQGGRSRWLVRSPDEAAGAVCAIVRDRKGVIWAGFNEGGLVRIVDGKTTTFHRKDGLASEAVQCLWSDDDGTLWIGTAGSGLSRFKNGRFATVSMTQGLADNVICHIVDDGRGFFWLSTQHGIQRVARTELEQCADGAIPTVASQIYDRSDGLPTIEFTGGLQAAGCRTSDGRLFFASSKGVVVVDPAQIRPNPTPPPVVIETVSVDGRNIPFTSGSLSHRLAPDHQRLEFQFSALSFVAPNKVLFKYRLDGIDDNWVDIGPRRAAFYSRLPAGDYRFHVIACNNDGVWNPAGASLTFTVAPFFWQTWWFLGSSVLVTLSAMGWLVRHITRRRLQQRVEQLEREHALEHERARIARDIHDDLGTSLTRISMLSQTAANKVDLPKQTATVLARIYATAHDVTRSLDEIVWAVDPRHDTLESLVSYMGKFSQDLLSAADIRCRFDLPVELPSWSLTAEDRHNLFLAFKEALNNVLKHSRASEVHISLHLNAEDFSLTIRDNGVGFTSEAATAVAPRPGGTGHGLPNLRRRLERIGGRCDISTTPGTGTTIAFVLPARHRARAGSRPRATHPPPPR